MPELVLDNILSDNDSDDDDYDDYNDSSQLTLFFGCKDFKMSCQKWAKRNNTTEALFDIYDGMIWKNFTDDNGELFFTKEYANSHIGLMINIDWF